MQRNRLHSDGRRRPAPRTHPLRSGTPATPGAGGGPGVEGDAGGTIPNAAPTRGRDSFRIETARHRAFLPCGLVAAGLLASAPAGAIVGGQPTDPDEYRWQVLVFAETGNRETDRIGFCGGTLIARDWVMTAAHCLDRPDGTYIDPSEVTVRVGSWRWESGGRVVPVSELHPHPDYDPDVDVNDIALLKLAESAPADLGAVAFPDEDTHRRIAVVGTEATALGWGVAGVVHERCLDDDEDNDAGCPALSPVLREVDLPLLPAGLSSCSSNLDPDAEICAGGVPGRDTCFSDSGGPLLLEERGTYYQIGITSSGSPQCDGNRGGTYARVARFHDWIRQTTRIVEDSPNAPARNAEVVAHAVANMVGRGAAQAAVDAIGGRYRARVQGSSPASAFTLAGRDMGALWAAADAGSNLGGPKRAAVVLGTAALLLGTAVDPDAVAAALPAAGAASEAEGSGDVYAGVRAWLDWQGVTSSDLLAGSAFNLDLSGDRSGFVPGTGGWSVWGEGAFNGFGSESAGISLDGGVASFHVGTDYRSGRWLLGMAVGGSKGETDFRDPAAGSPVRSGGTVEMELLNVLPYVQWSPDGRGESLVWGTAGAGSGEAGLKREGRETGRGDIETFMIAGGARLPLAWRVGGWDVAAKGDVLRVTSKTEALKTPDGTVQAAAGDRAHSLRLRGGAEFAKARELPSGAVDLRLELAGRLDDGYLGRGAGPGGPDEPSLGAEVGGSVEFTAVSGLTARLRGRYLAARGAGTRKEWGASARVAYAPGGAGRGPAFSVAPEWGEAESEAASTWSDGPWPESARAREHRDWIPSGTRVRMEHRLDSRGSRVLMKPYAEAYLRGESVERMRIGAKMEVLWRPGERMALETSVESVGGVEPDRVMLRGRLDF